MDIHSFWSFAETQGSGGTCANSPSPDPSISFQRKIFSKCLEQPGGAQQGDEQPRPGQGKQKLPGPSSWKVTLLPQSPVSRDLMPKSTWGVGLMGKKCAGHTWEDGT